MMQRNKQMSVAFNSGRAVWMIIKGKPLSIQRTYSNPYAIGTAEWADWENGFQGA
jgi:hypothetical protein